MTGSKIEWCDHTFNPWIGCAKISEGCRNCYAEAMMDTRYGRVEWGVGKPRSRTSPDNWKEPLRWQKIAAQGYFVEVRRDGAFVARGDVRKLTKEGVVLPGEYARLQGVPDAFQFEGSPRDAYRMIGNGVSVPVGRWIGQEICRYFGRRAVA